MLDFACGTGGLLERLSAEFETFGYDRSAWARGCCRTNVADAVIVEEWESLPPASFDVIVVRRSLDGLRRPLPILEKLAGKLVAGGALLLAVPNPSGLGRRLKGRRWFAFHEGVAHSMPSRGEWVMLLRKTGLEVVHVCGDGLWDIPYLPLVPVAFQRVLFAAPTALRAVWPGRRPWLPPMFGECLIFTARKSQRP